MTLESPDRYLPTSQFAMKQRLTLLLLFLAALFFNAAAQSWTKLQQWGGSGTEICGGLATGRDGAVFLTGSFENQITFGSQTLTAVGEADVFLCKLHPNGEVAWAKQAGSRLMDEVTDLALDADENGIVVGSYWLEVNFDTVRLTAGTHSKSVFIAKYNTAGQIQWAKSWNGSGLKAATKVVCDAANNIFVTGYFEKSLQIADTQLVAKGNTDLFVAKFSPAGQLQWAVRQGQKGDTRGTALGLTQNGDVVVGGYFNDSTRIADTTLTANTLDQDAFIARFSKDGMPVWAKKAGGVFDSDVTALVVDAADQIYVTGYFVGTMRLNPTTVIQSSSGQSDFFLLKYRSDGTPVAARSLGGRQLEQALDLTLQNNLLLVSGFYQGNLMIDSFQFASGNSLSGFVMGFDLNLQARWVNNLASDAALYASQVAADRAGNIWIGGSFTGNIRLGALRGDTRTFDLFLATLAFQPTSMQEVPSTVLFRLFPNPTNGQVFVQTAVPNYRLQVTNGAGQVVLQSENRRMLDFSQLPKGTYFVTFRGDFREQIFKIVW